MVATVLEVRGHAGATLKAQQTSKSVWLNMRTYVEILCSLSKEESKCAKNFWFLNIFLHIFYISKHPDSDLQIFGLTGYVLMWQGKCDSDKQASVQNVKF